MQGRSEFKTLVSEHSVLFGLIGLNVLVFLTESFLPQGALDAMLCIPEQIVSNWQALLAGNWTLSILQGFAPLLTYAFFHADIEHLLFNLLYLWIFGFLASQLLGHRWVLIIYILTAIGGAVCYVIFNNTSDIPMLGASGAVSGFEGAYLGLVVRYTLPNPFVWPLATPVSPLTLGIFAVVGFFIDLSGIVNPGMSNTAFATHLGGFATGIFLTSFVTGRPRL